MSSSNSVRDAKYGVQRQSVDDKASSGEAHLRRFTDDFRSPRARLDEESSGDPWFDDNGSTTSSSSHTPAVRRRNVEPAASEDNAAKR